MPRKIAYLTWGNGSQIRCFQDFAAYLDDMLYLPELTADELSHYAAVVVPDGMNDASIRPHAQALNDYVRGGGFLVVFSGRSVAEWLKVVDLAWKPIFTRDWLWWTKPGGRLEIYQPEPKHPICDVIPLRDMGWHWTGAFELSERATSALNLDDDRGSLFLDFTGLANGGRVIVSTLDPHVHHGERFMPATTRFLNAFYPWLSREAGRKAAEGRIRFTYLQCYDHPTEWRPAELETTLPDAGIDLSFLPAAALSGKALAGTDILYVPNNSDQFFLRRSQQTFLDFLARGGHLIICSEPALAWLPFLKPFHAVPPRPFTNLKVRVRNDPFGFFRNMDGDFDAWSGVVGQYARGWSEMPEGGVWLTDVGPQDCPRPADWLWQFPTDDGKGGFVVMHNGDNLIRYPDHGPHKSGLVRDICLGLMRQRRYHLCQPATAVPREAPSPSPAASRAAWSPGSGELANR